jgi:hypothetical protein
LQIGTKDPVVEATRRKSEIMDTGRHAVGRRGASIAAVIHSAKHVNSEHSGSTFDRTTAAFRGRRR